MSETLSFRKRVAAGTILFDGAMGTQLYNKGVFINRCFDEANLSRPDLVEQIHREFIAVGPDAIETNTYGANRAKLGAHGLADRVADINRAGVEIARRAAGDTIMVAGAVGPIGQPLAPAGSLAPEEAEAIFHEQIGVLLAAGVDLLVIETINSIAEMECAVQAARKLDTDVPIIAQLTFDDEGYSPGGDTAADLARYAERAPIDAVGANCGIGPQSLLDVVNQLAALTGRPISIMPNAGEPRYVDDRLMYLATPEYFGEYAKRFLQAGVRIIGGCCGTTPAHIEAIRKSVIQHQPSTARTTKVTVLPAAERPTTAEPVPTARKSPLAAKIGVKFVVSVELDPPKGVDPSKVIEGAMACRVAGVDAINIADGPRAIARMSPMAMAVMIRDQVGDIETIIHYCCRDRNVLGMQADMIGANALGLRNMIIITGDPPKLGNYPFATGVFDVDAIGAVRLASNLNHGIDLAGNPIAGATALYLGVGADPSSPTFEREVERFHQKVEAGAEFVMTQPVYDLRQLERFLEATADCRIPVLVGILPLASYKNAEFLNNEVPGIIIPEAVMKRMARHSAGEQAKKEGVAIAKETLHEARSMVQGTYIMPPFNRYEVALQILEAL